METAPSEYYQKLVTERGDKADSILQCFEDAENDNVTLNCGPTYLTTTSNNDDVIIKTFLVDYANSSGDYNYRTVCIIAENAQKKIVGARQSFFVLGGDKINSSGRIVTFERSSGIATAIELVHIDMLKREANSKGLPVVYEVQDDNSVKLAILKAQYESTHPLIEAKQEENRRWLSLYGPEGQLGFDTTGKIVIAPEPESVPLSDIDTITLQRAETIEHGVRRLKGVVSAISRGEPSELRIKKQRDYRRAVLPNLKILARGI